MLTEKNWPPEAVVRLLLSMLLCLFVGGVALELLAPAARLPPAERQRWSMIVGTLSFQGAGLVCLAVFVRNIHSTWREAFGLQWRGSGRALLLGALAGIGMLPITMFLGWLSAWAMTSAGSTPVEQVAVRVLTVEESLGVKVFLGFFTVVIVPFVEELIFRGVLYPTLRTVMHPTLALWGTSLFFAAIHFNVMTFVPLTVLALALTSLYRQTGNILAPFVTHALFNLANFLFLMFGFKPDG